MTTTAAPRGTKRRPLSPLRHRFFILFVLISLFRDFRVIAQQQEAEKDENVGEAPREDAFTEEHGLIVLSSLSDITSVLDSDESKLLLLAVYSPSCKHCTSLIVRLEHAARQFSEYFQSIHAKQDLLISSAAPLFAKLDATVMDPKVLQDKLGVQDFPTLITITGTQQNAMIHDWFGSIETSDQLYEMILHYWYRWNHDANGGGGALVHDVSSVDVFLQIHGAGALQMVPPALDPNLSLQEVSHMEWLLSDTRDAYILILTCSDEENEELQQVANVLAANRNVLFLHSQDCTDILHDGKNGTIAAVFVNPPTDWNQWKDSIVQTTIYDAQKYDNLEQWIVQMTTPYILWYDYKSVAPICFPKWRKIHAVLCVDVDDYEYTKRAIFDFYNACRHFRHWQEQDFVCLIVPQTERLIFNTLGVDIWSPLDFQATQGGPIQPVLPTLVITDSQFPTTTRQFHLSAPDLLLSSSSSIHDFMDQFWNQQLTPYMKSSSNEKVQSNDSGVQILTGATFFDAVMNQNEKHTLLYLFLPTCGHCKRFSIIWNELSHLLEKLGWRDTLFQIAKMDVSKNQVHEHLDSREVPQVYFIPRGTKTPIRYDVVDEFGNGVGRLSDSLDIVEWLLDVMADDEDWLDGPAELLQLLRREEEKDSVQAAANGRQHDNKANGSKNGTQANNIKENEQNLKESYVS